MLSYLYRVKTIQAVHMKMHVELADIVWFESAMPSLASRYDKIVSKMKQGTSHSLFTEQQRATSFPLHAAVHSA